MKKEIKRNPNRVKKIYLLNIIALCILVLLSVLSAVLIYQRYYAANRELRSVRAELEEARIDKLLKNAKADKIPGISKETKRHLAALMGDKASVNQELLKKYAEGGQARHSAILSLIKNFMNITIHKFIGFLGKGLTPGKERAKH